jgi:hypothetical protein
MEMGHKFAEIAKWKSAISLDLMTWIKVFFDGDIWTAPASPATNSLRTVPHNINSRMTPSRAGL